jgi:hypothetical protein
MKVRAKLNFVGTTSEGFNKIGQEWEVSESRAKELLERDLVEQVEEKEKKETVAQDKEKVEVSPMKKNNRGK